MATTEMVMREEHAMAPAGGALAAVSREANGVMALAFMSEQDFSARLAALKLGQDRVRMIQRELMTKDEDYGVIPGTDKPTILKPGAEKLCAVYGLRARPEPRITYGDGVATPYVSVLTLCYMHQGAIDGPNAGPVVAIGVGSANSWERKHRYRGAGRSCPSCGVVGSIRRSSFEKDGDKGWYCNQKAGGCGAGFHSKDASITEQQNGQIENPDQFDLENTLVKMSKKRAFLDGTLTATATSGLFAQDLDETVEDDDKPKGQAKQAQPTGPSIITKSQAEQVTKAIAACGLPIEDAKALVKKVAGVDSLAQLTTDKLQATLEAFARVGAVPAQPDPDADGAEREPYVPSDSDTEWMNPPPSDQPTASPAQERQRSTPACPQCGGTKSVIADKFKPGFFKCWEKGRTPGCGKNWSPEAGR
jgi:hypothetical protein